MDIISMHFFSEERDTKSYEKEKMVVFRNIARNNCYRDNVQAECDTT